MFVVLVEFEAHEAHISAFLAAVKRQAFDSLANEPDCHRFDVCLDNEAASSVVLYEIYTNAHSFQEHLATPHFKSFNDNTKHMVKSKTVRTMTLQEGGKR